MGGNQDIFKQLPDRNGSYLKVVVKKAEEIFSNLEVYLEGLKQWGVLGILDVETFEQLVHTPEEWEANIKILKLKKKEVEKVQDYSKIDCFVVSTNTLKQQVEDSLSKLMEQLSSTLKI